MALRSQVPPGQAFLTRIVISREQCAANFPSTSALAFTVIAERCTSVSEPVNSGELPVWAILDAVTALRLRRS